MTAISYSDQRLQLHRRAAVLDPDDIGITRTPETLRGAEGRRGGEPIYHFEGTFWAIFRDVFEMACQRVHIANRQKGFWPNDVKPDGTPDERGRARLDLYPDTHGRNVGEALMLMTSEGAEGLEAYRTGGLDQKDDKLPERSGLYTEIADKVIRAMDFLGGMFADGGAIITEKLTFNKNSRGYLHGKKF